MMAEDCRHQSHAALITTNFACKRKHDTVSILSLYDTAIGDVIGLMCQTSLTLTTKRAVYIWLLSLTYFLGRLLARAWALG